LKGGLVRLDDFLPQYHFNEIHSIAVQASPGQVLRSVKELTPRELSPVFHLLFALRSFPERIFGKNGMQFAGARPLLDQMFDEGFILLAETPGRELVFGILIPAMIGRFWKPLPEMDSQLTSARDFIAFDHLDYVKVAADFTVERDGVESARVSTETRIQALSPYARKNFARYWRLIYPGSALIRKVWLKAIKQRAERRET
jgi:hypothetical protein